MNTHKTPRTGWKGITSHWRSDFLAAISVSLVALPLGLGVAAASGAPPISGLISAIVGGIVATLFRGSHLAINGPAAGLIAVILSSIYSLDDGSGNTLNYVLAAIFIAGLIQVLLGLLKLGRIAEIIPSSVIQGIMVAIGIIIFSTQIHVGMGTHPAGTDTISLLKEIATQIPNIHPIIFGITFISIILLVFIPKIQSRVSHYFPASLWVLAVSIAAAYIFNFFDPHTVELFGNSYAVGPQNLISLPDNLMDAIIYPDFSRIGDYQFWIAVVSICLIASIQTLAMAKAVDKLDPYKRKSDLNKELIGMGLATAVSGAIGGLPIITVIVRSTVNVNNNAMTKWSNFYHGLLIILFLFILAPVIQMIPIAALAAILLYIGFRLASPTVFIKTYKLGMEQLLFMLVTIVITLNSDLLWGILGGSLFALMVHLLLSRMPAQDFFHALFSDKSNLENTKDGHYDFHIDGVASFLTIPKLSKIMDQIPIGSNVTINLSGTRLVGMTVMEFLIDFIRMQKDAGGNVIITGLDSHVQSSTHNRALKISLNSYEAKLSPRQNRLKNLADEQDYQFKGQVDWNTSYFKNFHFFKIRGIERKSNALIGNYASLNMGWEIADITFSEGAAFNAEVFNASVMVLKLNKKIPLFSLEKEGVFEKIFDRILAMTGYRDIDFSMYSNISKEFLVMGRNETAVRAFFTDEVVRFMETHQLYHLESNGEALLIFDKVKLARTDETMKLIKYGEELGALLDRQK
jgi:MFS superfamily sulfate permease-like transporter